MKRLWIAGGVALGAIALAGCVTQSEVYLPDGARGYSLNCDGMMQGWGACLERAGQICQSQGYRIFDRSGQAIPVGSLMTSGGQMTGFGGSAIYRNVLVGCGTGRPAAPAAPAVVQ